MFQIDPSLVKHVTLNMLPLSWFVSVSEGRREPPPNDINYLMCSNFWIILGKVLRKYACQMNISIAAGGQAKTRPACLLG